MKGLTQQRFREWRPLPLSRPYYSPRRPSAVRNWVFAFTGYRGSGKTASMVLEAYRWHRRYAKEDIGIWANIDIRFPDFPPVSGGSIELLAETFLSPQSLPPHNLVLLDEAYLALDAYKHADLLVRIISAGISQSRKWDMSFYFTVPSLGWLATRARWHVDVEIQCADPSLFSPLYQKGHWSLWRLIDRSGAFSGAHPDECPRHIGTKLVPIRLVWDWYETRETVDIGEMLLKANRQDLLKALETQTPTPVEEILGSNDRSLDTFIIMWWNKFGREEVTVDKLLPIASETLLRAWPANTKTTHYVRGMLMTNEGREWDMGNIRVRLEQVSPETFRLKRVGKR